MQVHITKWGNSLGLRVPKDMAQTVGLTEGDKVEIEAKDNRIVITPVRPSYNLRDLLKGTTPEEYRRNAVDWGPDEGREIAD